MVRAELMMGPDSGVRLSLPGPVLVQALEAAWACNVLPTRCRVVDQKAFIQAFQQALNAEDEDGSTLVTKMLDRALLLMVENGEDGLEEVKHGARDEDC